MLKCALNRDPQSKTDIIEAPKQIAVFVIAAVHMHVCTYSFSHFSTAIFIEFVIVPRKCCTYKQTYIYICIFGSAEKSRESRDSRQAKSKQNLIRHRSRPAHKRYRYIRRWSHMYICTNVYIRRLRSRISQYKAKKQQKHAQPTK